MILIKNKEQINGIRKSCKLAASCLEMIEEHIRPGISTNEINDIISSYIKKNNAIAAPLNYNGFPKETCISINEVVCHGIPSDRKLIEGDVINIDVTTILDGYFGDTSKMFAIGKISQEAQDLLNVTKDSLYKSIKVIKPNVPFNRIGYEISQNLKNTNYGIVDMFVGHGCGLHFHEDPKICHYVDEKFKDFGPRMQPGMIFTIEPMINLGTEKCIILEDRWTAVTADKKISAQYEHMVLCTDDGYEILTEL